MRVFACYATDGRRYAVVVRTADKTELGVLHYEVPAGAFDPVAYAFGQALMFAATFGEVGALCSHQRPAGELPTGICFVEIAEAKNVAMGVMG